MRAAERQRQLVPMRNLQAAGTKYWRAAAWFLERSNPHEFSRRKPQEVSPEQLAGILEQFAEILVGKISNTEDRRAVVDGMRHLIGELRSEETPWDVDPPEDREPPPQTPDETVHDDKSLEPQAD